MNFQSSVIPRRKALKIILNNISSHQIEQVNTQKKNSHPKDDKATNHHSSQYEQCDNIHA